MWKMKLFNHPQAGPSGALQNQVGKQPGGTQPNTAQPDRFGLLGLLSVIRMTDPDLTTLALGTDLTTLGLHLNSSDNVYKTFAHPWADNPLRPEPDFSVSDAEFPLCLCARSLRQDLNGVDSIKLLAGAAHELFDPRLWKKTMISAIIC